jgi:hypothetical protein
VDAAGAELAAVFRTGEHVSAMAMSAGRQKTVSCGSTPTTGGKLYAGASTTCHVMTRPIAISVTGASASRTLIVLLATLYAAAQVAIPWGDDTACPLANIPMGAWSSTPWTRTSSK